MKSSPLPTLLTVVKLVALIIQFDLVWSFPNFHFCLLLIFVFFIEETPEELEGNKFIDQ